MPWVANFINFIKMSFGIGSESFRANVLMCLFICICTYYEYNFAACICLHQLKSTIFNRFQLAANNFFHVFEMKISCIIFILTVQQILLKRLILSKEGSIISFLWILFE